MTFLVPLETISEYAFREKKAGKHVRPEQRYPPCQGRTCGSNCSRPLSVSLPRRGRDRQNAPVEGCATSLPCGRRGAYPFFEGHLAEGDAGQAEVAQIPAWAASDLAAVADAIRIRVEGQLGQLLARLKLVLIRGPGIFAFLSVLFDGLLALCVLCEYRLLGQRGVSGSCHLVLQPTVYQIASCIGYKNNGAGLARIRYLNHRVYGTFGDIVGHFHRCWSARPFFAVDS